ncbi:hypothetical protein N9522_00665 [Candidatus Thioglobus sp.]|nr:hypothetical protein [Candidatus Thioglobus sp.]
MIKIKDLRIFAFIWSCIFIIIGLSLRINIFFYISCAIIVIAIIKPFLLNFSYKIWIKIGEFIGGIISKIIMFALYFGLFTPVSIFLKILRKDLLNKKVDKSKSTYWNNRERQPESMKNQF